MPHNGRSEFHHGKSTSAFKKTAAQKFQPPLTHGVAAKLINNTSSPFLYAAIGSSEGFICKVSRYQAYNSESSD